MGSPTRFMKMQTADHTQYKNIDIETYKRLDKEVFDKLIFYIIANSRGHGVKLEDLAIYYASLLGIRRSKLLRNRTLFSKVYYAVYRLVKELYAKGILEVRTFNGIYVRINSTLFYYMNKEITLKAYRIERAGGGYILKPSTTSPTQVDLIPLYGKILSIQNSIGGFVPPESNGSRRIHWARKGALEFIKDKHLLTESDFKRLFYYFIDYLDDVNSRVILVLTGLDEDLDNVEDKSLLFLPYRHRFTKRELRRAERKLEAILQALGSLGIGVFLTLTLDPKAYSSIEEAKRRLQESWDKFNRDYLKRKFPQARYVRVLEFQDSGNPHLHVLIAGVDRIGDHYELTNILPRYGFGSIHFEYQVVFKDGKWVWKNPRVKPRYSRGCNTLNDYLMKYLSKAVKSFEVVYEAVYENEVDKLKPKLRVQGYKFALYWVLNVRFFTYSRGILPPEKRSRKYNFVVFIKQFYYDDPPQWIVDAGIVFYEYDYFEWRLEALDPPVLKYIKQFLYNRQGFY